VGEVPRYLGKEKIDGKELDWVCICVFEILHHVRVIYLRGWDKQISRLGMVNAVRKMELGDIFERVKGRVE